MAAFAGRCVLVTGAGAGMGRSHATLFAERGARVIVHDIDGAGADETANSIRASGGTAIAAVADISDPAAFRAAVGAAERDIGPIDILINNAGIGGTQRWLDEISEAEFDRLFAVNVKGCFFTTQFVARGMRERRFGRIVNISSTFGIAGSPSQSHYGGAKAALLSFTKTWARELAPHNITVNAVAPGFVVTNMTRGAWPPERIPQRVEPIPLKRAGEPVEISYAVAWLASDEAAYVTGQVLSPNGGEYIY
jgi:3-oxoacyl-[acyl-carrier protein] reductase